MIPLQHLSFSSISDIEACLMMTHAKRIAPNPIPEIPDARRDSGSLAHKMIELAIRTIARQETVDEVKLRDGIPLQAMMQSPLSHNAVYEDALAVYRRWLRDFSVHPNDIFGVEREGSCRVEGVPVPLVGRDDLVTVDAGEVMAEMLIATDFKTRWAATVTPEDELQGDLAALRLAAEYPGKLVGSSVNFPRLGITSPFRELTHDRRLAAEARVRKAWVTLVEADKRNEWPATPGAHCQFCPLAIGCAKRALTDGAGLTVNTPESAEEALRYRILFAEAQKRLTAPLQAWARDNGPVKVGRAVAGYNASETEAISDVEAALARLTPGERQTLKPALKLDGRNAAVKRLYDDSRLEDLITTKVGKPRFAVRGTSADLDAEDGGELEEESDD